MFRKRFGAFLILSCIYLSADAFQVQEVEHCKLEQCIPLSSSVSCPKWDTECISSVAYFINCMNGDTFDECVIGREKLKELDYTDEYPVELQNCTQLCKQPETTSNAKSDFYEKFVYNCRYGCEQLLKPSHNFDFVMKGDQTQCELNTCITFGTPDFLKKKAQYDQCAQQSYYQNSKNAYNKLKATDKFPYNMRASHIWCQQDPAQPYKEYDDYYNCVSGCQIVQPKPTPQSAVLVNYLLPILAGLWIQVLLTLY